MNWIKWGRIFGWICVDTLVVLSILVLVLPMQLAQQYTIQIEAIAGGVTFYLFSIRLLSSGLMDAEEAYFLGYRKGLAEKHKGLL
jgi:hypothetical protein